MTRKRLEAKLRRRAAQALSKLNIALLSAAEQRRSIEKQMSSDWLRRLQSNIFEVAFPGDATAFREYRVPLPYGRSASIAFALGKEDGPLAANAREVQASAFGLVSLTDYPNGPRRPLCWLQTTTMFAVLVSEHDDELSDEVQRIIRFYARAFFRDIATIAPELSALHERAGLLH